MLLHLSDSCTHCSSARLFPRHRHDWQIPSRICFARVHAHVPWFRRVSRYAMSIGKNHWLTDAESKHADNGQEAMINQQYFLTHIFVGKAIAR